LDSAAGFVPAAGPIAAFWKPSLALPATAAIDMGTRELSEPDARATTERLACLMDTAEVAFKKLDSQLRGHTAIEILACLASFHHCVIAPAFPFHGRVTRHGRQLVREGRDWRALPPDLPGDLHRLRIPVSLCQPGNPAPPGVSLWDAETDADLAAIVAAALDLPGRVLWCGSGGLAGALAAHAPVPAPELPMPVLALIGSDHPVSVAQLSAAWKQVQRIARGSGDEADLVARRLARANTAVAVVLPPGTDRTAAARHIETCFAGLLSTLGRPGTLLVSGGETLRTVCDTLGAESLEVDGELMPGVPASVMCGGRWDGLRVLSKSGAFGDSGLLVRLLARTQDDQS
jgi:uncharacterized protein YgbK (DUF1537 family)